VDRGHPGEDTAAVIERAKEHAVNALREDGETREIYFEEPLVIFTGVPRSVEFGRY
jgi:hypothetical protein